MMTEDDGKWNKEGERKMRYGKRELRIRLHRDEELWLVGCWFIHRGMGAWEISVERLFHRVVGRCEG